MRCRGFSLVELLVAIAIGAVVCGTAFAAVRAASQAFTVGSRLSIENQLMRSGVYAALDELDTWNWYDDPGDPLHPNPPSSTPLRGVGDPFHPLDLSEDFNFDCQPIRDPSADYEAWWRRDSRAWWRGDPTSEDNTTGMKLMGNCALYGKVDITDSTVLSAAERRWYHKLVRDGSSQLGYYALLDLGPPCLMATYYDSDMDRNMTWGDTNPVTNGVVPPEFYSANHGGTGSFGTSWWDDRPHDWLSLTLGGFYTVAIPSRATDPRHQIANINRAMFLTWLADGSWTPNAGWTADDAFNSVGGRLDVMPVKPAQWPDLRVTVRHYAANGRQFHAGYVLLQNPTTGQDFKLRFSYTGTTLGGARRTRGLDHPFTANPP